jgi:hypothetical protein
MKKRAKALLRLNISTKYFLGFILGGIFQEKLFLVGRNTERPGTRK